MTAAAERLVHLAGTTGTAAALLMMIGSGASAGAAMVDYSGLPTGTAAEHILTDKQQETPVTMTGGGYAYRIAPARIGYPLLNPEGQGEKAARVDLGDVGIPVHAVFPEKAEAAIAKAMGSKSDIQQAKVEEMAARRARIDAGEAIERSAMAEAREAEESRQKAAIDQKTMAMLMLLLDEL